MKKIAIVAQGLNDGGAERVASILANYLSGRGYKLVFIAAYKDVVEYKLNEKIKIEFIHTSKRTNIERLADRNLQILKIIKREKIDKVISFITNEVILTELVGVPTIHTLRNDPERVDNGFVMRNFRNIAYRLADHVVFQTQGARDYFSSAIQKKSSIIANPMLTSKLPKWDKNSTSKTFITACRLNEQKNLPMLIKAFKGFHIKHDDFTLEIYGEGELREQLESLIVEVDGQEYIRLMGRSNQIYSLMQNAYAFVLSSNYEGLSNSMLEALAIGVPCICTDCPPGGARTYITDGINGLLTPVGDQDALENAMEKLASDKAFCCTLSDKATVIRDRIEHDKVCALWEQLL